MLRLTAAAVLLLGGVCAAQTPPAAGPPPPCQSPQARQFDFWLGEWDLIGRMRLQPGADRWRETRSTNSIRSVMDSCVTQESFDNQQPNAWSGMSVSTWSARTGQWQQTWVDSQGGYIPLTGQFADGRMILTTPERPAPSGPGGGTAVNRMVFHDIARDSLLWDWELSTDGGQTWEVQWSITYRRRK